MKNIRQTMILCFLLIGAMVSRSQDHNISVAFLGLNPSGNYTAEISAAYDFLSQHEDYKATELSVKDIRNGDISPEKINVIWIHRPDSSVFSPEEKHTVLLHELRDYLEDGGKVLLTLEAMKYINFLGLEENKVETRYKEAEDSGYGRMLGFHSYRGHPVFEGLHGGAYINKPVKDITVRQLGFFEDAIPGNGKVVAVDWDYIFLRENKKLLLEYEVGTGKVIAVGAYAYFGQENINRPHLEKFMRNSINYLTGKIASTDKFYWDYSRQFVRPFQPENIRTELNAPERWIIGDGGTKLERKISASQFWDVAGQRMLIMGKENGGIDEVWAHPFMALRDYQVGLAFEGSDSIIWLDEMHPSIEVRPGSFARKYSFKDGILHEYIVAHPTEAKGIIHYEYESNDPARLYIKYKTNMRLMWPYSEKSNRLMEYAFASGLNAFVVKDKSGDMVSVLGANKIPDEYSIGRSGYLVLEEDTLTDPFEVTARASYRMESVDKLDIILAASNEGLDKTVSYYRTAMESPYNVYREIISYHNGIDNRNLRITSPDKVFNEGFQWAVRATDRFFVRTPGLGASFVAGYATTARGWDGGHDINGRPGYGWYFGRDGEWSGFAILDYGDFKKVRSMLELFRDFQDLNGKILHELSTSGLVHYDASDATPLYIVLAGKYFKHSGDTVFLRESWPSIKKAVDFCYSTDTDGDRLIENTNVGHGWVEGGHLFGSHSSLYLVSCWAEALENAAFMARHLGYDELSEKYREDGEFVEEWMNDNFWDDAMNHYHQGLYQDGSFHRAQTIMPSIPMYFEQVPGERAVLILRKFASNNYSSDWGVRIVGKDNPNFNPGGYHTGSVWPLFTGWTALAEYEYKRPVQGYTHIMNNLLVYRDWALGFVEEVLHGREYKPFGVCPHQCWSETMVIQSVIEGMLGMKPCAPENILEFRPALPAGWDHIKVENIRIGIHTVDWEMRKQEGKIIYSFTNDAPAGLDIKFSPFLPPGTKIRNIAIDNRDIIFEAEAGEHGLRVDIPFRLEAKSEIELKLQEGISVLPQVYDVIPGRKSEGARIIDASTVGDAYRIILEGKAGKQEIIHVFTGDYIIDGITNASISDKQGKIVKLLVDFNGENEDYTTEIVEIRIINPE